MQTFKLAARLLSGAAVLAMAACASTPEAPTASPPPPPAPSPEPAPAPPPTKEVYPIEMDRGAGAYPDDLEDYYESLPPPGAGAPEIAASRTSFREASRSGKPVQDYLPYIDVAIEQDVLVSGMGPSLQDRYTRIQIVTLDPDSYDVAGVAGDGRKSKKETRDY